MGLEPILYRKPSRLYYLYHYFQGSDYIKSTIDLLSIRDRITKERIRMDHEISKGPKCSDAFFMASEIRQTCGRVIGEIERFEYVHGFPFPKAKSIYVGHLRRTLSGILVRFTLWNLELQYG